jgi:exopolysaccharide biosynthesis operon protein EpsL
MAAPAAMAQISPMSTPQADPGPEGEGLHFRVLAGIEHDSNVLRTTNNTISDTAYMAGVGISYNKRFSLQRIRADIEADTYRYSNHSGLNYNTINYSAAWDWQVTPAFHGTISADRRQFREVTADPLFASNLIGRRTERNEIADAQYDFAGGLRALAGVGHSRAESTQPRSWDASPDITFAHAGVGYEFPSGTLATLRYREGRGEYTDPSFTINNRDFRDHEVEAGLRWAATGKTTLDARIAHRKREHDGAPQLDFSGMIGAATVNWEITGKTRLVAGYVRDLSATGLTVGGKVVSDRFYLNPRWAATAKTSFHLRYDHIRRDWDDLPVAAPDFGRSEKLDSTQVGVDWEALRWLTVTGYVRNERLKSSLSGGYKANVYGIAAKASF